MTETTLAWIEELERTYGVSEAFSRRLAPLLDCLVEQSLGEPQRAALFAAIAAAYRSMYRGAVNQPSASPDPSPDRSEPLPDTARPAQGAVPSGGMEPGAETGSFEEVRFMVSHFMVELRKMDESLKVLGAMMQRVREQMTARSGSRIVH